MTNIIDTYAKAINGILSIPEWQTISGLVDTVNRFNPRNLQLKPISMDFQNGKLTAEIAFHEGHIVNHKRGLPLFRLENEKGSMRIGTYNDWCTEIVCEEVVPREAIGAYIALKLAQSPRIPTGVKSHLNSALSEPQVYTAA